MYIKSRMMNSFPQYSKDAMQHFDVDYGYGLYAIYKG